MHRRYRPKRHQLIFRVFSMLIDLDELPSISKGTVGFSHNRFNLLSFYDSDHGPGTGESLRDWVESHLRNAKIELSGGPIRLLCYPRIFGYVFNPLSVYFCYQQVDGAETLVAILYEVNNTFRERHTYLIPVLDYDRTQAIHQSCEKKMYVSPFLDMDMTYNFRIRPPSDDISVAIHETNRDGAILDASFSGIRKAISSAKLIKTLARFPLMPIKVIGGIHWEALKLWVKGVPLVHHTEPPANPVTMVVKKTKTTT
ncbi:MAG TPA: DUF1365 domain-containing protein [Rhodospirillaceae bacterium]|nr:DUF1365 domain-containing protein [Candidatus Neomarinimicrobiota bacterium]HCX14949.1 DUF1365 domain-containing protein [Rhodospirillaceae bacterium]